MIKLNSSRLSTLAAMLVLVLVLVLVSVHGLRYQYHGITQVAVLFVSYLKAKQYTVCLVSVTVKVKSGI